MSDILETPAPRIWEPTLKQEQFISLPFSIFEGLFGGAVGGGKSELLVMLPLIYQFHLHPRFKGIILRRTFPELEKEIIIRSEFYYPNAGGRYNAQNKVWKFPSGARIFFGHAENEKDIRNYDGVEYNYVAYDELPSFTEFQYLYLAASRARSSTPDLPAIIRNSAMPGNIGNEWVRARFVEPHPEGGRILYDPATKQKRIFIQSLPQDNKYLLQNDPGYLDRLALLPEAERRAKLGDWWIFSGQVFDNFRIEPLSDEPENAKHVIEPIEIPDFWPKVLAIDWGFKANTIALWGAISPNGRAYIYREYCIKQAQVAEWATEIGELARLDKNLKVVKLDTNAWDQRGEEKTIAEQFEQFSKLRPEPASKGRISGKMLVQEYLRWKQRPKTSIKEEFDEKLSQLIFKNRGLDAYKEYLARFAPQPDESNLPKLQIFETCRELIKIIPLCVYDEKNLEDVKEFNGDDAYDCLRYLIKGIVNYQDESKNVFDRLRKEDQINTRLQETGDFTSFVMARKQLEAQSGRFGVSRYHKARM